MPSGSVLSFAAALSMALPGLAPAAEGGVIWSAVCGDPDKRVAIPIRGQPAEHHGSKACHACTWRKAGGMIVAGGEGARV